MLKTHTATSAAPVPPTPSPVPLTASFRSLSVTFCALAPLRVFFFSLCESPCAFSAVFEVEVDFFLFRCGPGTSPEVKKPLKPLYCRQISRFRHIRASPLLGPLWEASGVAFGLLLGACGLLRALLVPTWDPKGCQSRTKCAKKRGLKSVLAPTVGKRVPKGAQDLSSGPKIDPNSLKSSFSNLALL